jgi:carbon monoxide dehydrogenase subunit G
MLIENSFDVTAPRQRAWDLLMDVPRVIPCMPGAELSETVDETHWKAKLGVKLGPISLTFATDVEQTEADEPAGTVLLSVKAREVRGRGGAQATVRSTLTELDGKTRIDITTDLALSGAVAQYGRGIVHDVSAQLVSQFAECLEAQLAGSREEAEAAVEGAAKPVSGMGVGFRAFRSTVSRVIGRLFGRSAS